MGKKRIVFVINPRSGQRKGLAYKETIEKKFTGFGFDFLTFLTSEHGSNSAFSLGKMAAQEGFYSIVGVGGDGTQNLLINGMMESGIPIESLPNLGFIRAGTGNNVAKDIGIPAQIEEALNIVKNGQIRLIDIGLLTARKERKYFINVVSFGFDALVVEKMNRLGGKRKFLPKDLIYLITAGQRIFAGFPLYHFTISTPEFNLETDSCLLAVMNGPSYGAIFIMAPDADFSDGLLDACLIGKIGKLKGLNLLFLATKGKHVKSPQVKSFKFSSLQISCPDPLPCEIDGELGLAEKNYEISILPSALKVLTPNN